ncbi:MAG: serine/threonine protein kinase [Alphaproteobacteria bacterium]|nr:serine/threonine protein kinase [Alphaproteobacteria bacterium]
MREAARGAPVTPASGEYRILDRIGRGGFGEVYRAQKVAAGGFRKDVALKMLNADMVQVNEVASRLKDEARILGMLNHRAIVKVDLLALFNDRWTVVMEYVEGADLKQVLNHHGTLPLFAALEIGAEVASALDYAYNHEIVDPADPAEGRHPLRLLHRDIKPSNIQLTPHGDVKVLDFGIARAEFASREAVTGTNMLLTREYAAPERLRAVEHPGGDVFSLGAVLFELITGTRLNLLGPMVDALLHGKSDFNMENYRDQRMARAWGVLKTVEGMNRALANLLLLTLAWSPERRPTARILKKELRRHAAILQEQESLGEWCERVVGPMVAERRKAKVDAPSGALTGRTLATDGHTFELRSDEPDLARTVLMKRSPPPRTPSIQPPRPKEPALPTMAVAVQPRLDAPTLHPEVEPPRPAARGLSGVAMLMVPLVVLVGLGAGLLVWGLSSQGAAPASGRVTLSGDAPAVLLSGDPGTFEVTSNGLEVPAGSYVLQARWPTGELSPPLGVHQLLPGGELALHCDASLGACTSP